jgi:hypothetical protein
MREAPERHLGEQDKSTDDADTVKKRLSSGTPEPNGDVVEVKPTPQLLIGPSVSNVEIFQEFQTSA